MLLSLAVNINRSVNICINEVFEVVPAGEDIVHAFPSQEVIHLLITIDLESYSAEETVSI